MTLARPREITGSRCKFADHGTETEEFELDGLTIPPPPLPPILKPNFPFLQPLFHLQFYFPIFSPFLETHPPRQIPI